MLRNLYTQLLDWKSSLRRKPLILQGARQVGKTHLLKHFASQEYSDFLYLNFEEEPRLKAFFQEDLRPERIINEFEIYFKKSLLPEKTLLIFDEIQECPEALNSLKYFCETKNEIHLIAAGSLLGVKLAPTFPVGKVNFLHLYPMSFFEFLLAMDEKALVLFLKKLKLSDTIPLPFHEKLLKWLKYYLIIGGMPEVVDAYKTKTDLDEVRIIQKEILNTYALDFAKHAPPHDVMKIMAVWQQIPSQLAKENKKFIFSAIRQSARSREYESAIQWLVAAGLTIKTQAITAPGLPLKAYVNFNAFKIYTLDVGLLGAMSQLEPRLLLDGHRLFEEFKGALTENFAAQMLQNHYQDNLYYWESSGTAEVDFVINKENTIFPLEIKSGISKHKKSLQVFGEKYLNTTPMTTLSRANPLSLKQNGNFVNYPLYLLELFPL